MTDYWRQPYPVRGKLQESRAEGPYVAEKPPLPSEKRIVIAVPKEEPKKEESPRSAPEATRHIPSWPLAPDGEAYSYLPSNTYQVYPSQDLCICLYPRYYFKPYYFWITPFEGAFLECMRFGNMATELGVGQVDTRVFSNGQMLPVSGELPVGNVVSIYVINKANSIYECTPLLVGTFPKHRT